MNARDRILDRLYWAVPSWGEEDAKRIASEMLDEFAHELAEEIRAFVGPESYPHEKGRPLVLRYVKGWRDAADLIDPKKEK